MAGYMSVNARHSVARRELRNIEEVLDELRAAMEVAYVDLRRFV
jgi:hypothetical protein